MRLFLRRCGHFWCVVLFVAEWTVVGCGGSAVSENDPRERPAGNAQVMGYEDFVIAAPNRYLLFADVSSDLPVVLDLDKQKALALFGPEWSRQTRLLDVDSTALLENVVVTIRDACGTGWKNDANDPGYDCSKTALGRSFGSNWRTSPEFAFVRLLGTTPANADLDGTSLADFAKLVNKNPATFRFDFAEVLATALGIRRNETIVPTWAIVRSLQRNLIGTHEAAMNESGRLPVSLHDALLDLAPLADKFGPVGRPPYIGNAEHPGILLPDDATFRTKSNVLHPNFRMRVVARSNLRRVHGIAFSSGAGDMFVPVGNAPLSFDFTDPETFTVQGVENKPTIDMRIAIAEAPAASPCASNPLCRPFFIGNIVREATLLAYGQRVYHRCYVAFGGGCLVGIDIGKQGTMPGFAVFANDIETVKVPAPQFLWDLFTEVAMVQVHDPTGDAVADIPPGQARPLFAMRDIPIGIRAAELVEQMRPVLQAQQDAIADIIAGNHWHGNDDLDAFVMHGLPTEKPYLFFAGPSDRRPDPSKVGHPKPYRYERPGFFSRPDLAEASRVSRTAIPGVDDTEHEKVLLATGTHVLYAQNGDGDVYELTIFVPDDIGQTFPLEISLKNLGRSD